MINNLASELLAFLLRHFHIGIRHKIFFLLVTILLLLKLLDLIVISFWQDLCCGEDPVMLVNLFWVEMVKYIQSVCLTLLLKN